MAASKVFGVSEILEEILIYVAGDARCIGPNLYLYRMLTVNKSFNATILGSRELQSCMYLRPPALFCHEAYCDRTPCREAESGPSGWFLGVIHERRFAQSTLTSEGVCECHITLNAYSGPTWRGVKLTLKQLKCLAARYMHPQASWRRMPISFTNSLKWLKVVISIERWTGSTAEDDFYRKPYQRKSDLPDVEWSFPSSSTLGDFADKYFDLLLAVTESAHRIQTVRKPYVRERRREYIAVQVALSRKYKLQFRRIDKELEARVSEITNDPAQEGPSWQPSKRSVWRQDDVWLDDSS